MSDTPLHGNYQPSIPPWTPESGRYSTPSGAAHGQRLFDDITEFYSWYVSSWCLSGGDPASPDSLQRGDSTRKHLSLLKRVAEVSMNGGYYLSEKEESRAVNGLSDILQDLSGGRLRSQDLPGALHQLMLDLTEENPKAKVVSQTTELEYRFCINPPPEQSSDRTEQCRQALSQIIQKINPELRAINASAISQGLTQILEKPEAIEDINNAIQDAVKHWL